jgi:putative NADH-flavin reductase
VPPFVTLYVYDTHMQVQMMVAVLGGTGRTGQPLVAELLRRGHKVVVLARDPAKLGTVRDEVQVVTGDSRDDAALIELVSGADAVVSTLGPVRQQDMVTRDTAKALISVMRRAGVRRYIGVTGAGIDVPGDQKPSSTRCCPN